MFFVGEHHPRRPQSKRRNLNVKRIEAVWRCEADLEDSIQAFFSDEWRPVVEDKTTAGEHSARHSLLDYAKRIIHLA